MSVAQRVGAALRIRPGMTLPLLVAALVGVMAITAVATGLRALPTVTLIAVGSLAALVCVRWPLFGLLGLVVLIPIEEVGAIPGFGTLSRLAGLLFAVTYALPRLTSIRVSAMPFAGWAFLALAIASMAWAVDPATSWSGLPTLIQLFVVAVLIADYVSRQPAITRPIIVAYSISAAGTALLGIGSYLTGIGIGSRAAAIEGQNPAQFAAVLLPAFAFGFNEAVNGGRRMAGGVIALLTLVAIVVSGTRAGWVALAVVPLLVIPNLSPRRIAAAVSAVALLAVLTLQLPGVSDLVAERTGNAISTGGAGRADIWSVGLVIYESSPVLGVGYGNFPVAYTAEVVRDAGITSAYTSTGRAPHNIVIGTLAELGPFGVVLLGLLLVPFALRRGWGPDATAIRAAMASLLTMALFLDIVGNRKQVWLVLGLAAGLTWVARHRAATAEAAARLPDGGRPAG
jgi:O-antigen ligase